MSWKDPADFRNNYTDEQLAAFLRDFPTHVHRSAAQFESDRRDAERRHRQNRMWTLLAIVIGAAVAFTLAALPQCRVDKPPANSERSPANIVPPTSPSNQAAPALPTPAPTAAALTPATATPTPISPLTPTTQAKESPKSEPQVSPE